MSKIRVTSSLDYVMGHLRYGHLEMEIEKEKWKSMSEEEQRECLVDEGELIIDDYSVDDMGDMGDIETEDVEE